MFVSSRDICFVVNDRHISMLIVVYVCVFQSSTPYLIVRHIINHHHCLCLCLPELHTVSLFFDISMIILRMFVCPSVVCPSMITYLLWSRIFYDHISSMITYLLWSHIFYDHISSMIAYLLWSHIFYDHISSMITYLLWSHIFYDHASSMITYLLRWHILYDHLSSKITYLQWSHIFYDHCCLCLCFPETNKVPYMFNISSMIIVLYMSVFQTKIPCP